MVVEDRAQDLAAGEWPAATDPVDAAIRRAAAGDGPPEDVHLALLTACLLVERDGPGPLIVHLPDGEPAVPVYTHSAHRRPVPGSTLEWMPAADLLAALPDGHALLVNFGGPVGARLETAALRAVG